MKIVDYCHQQQLDFSCTRNMRIDTINGHYEIDVMARRYLLNVNQANIASLLINIVNYANNLISINRIFYF